MRLRRWSNSSGGGSGTLAGTTTTLTASPTSVSSGASVTFTAKVALPRAAEPPSMDLLGAIPSKKAAHQFFSARATLQEIREARIACRAFWGNRTVSGFPRRKPHIIALSQYHAAGSPGRRKPFSWFSPKENHTSRLLLGHSNCETALMGTLTQTLTSGDLFSTLACVRKNRRGVEVRQRLTLLLE